MLVSVIIPVYNSESTIYRCIESVVISLERVTMDYEIICIDDGSKDNSLQLLNEIASQNSKVFVVHQENSGAATARNKGLDLAKGDYIAFNDSDDEWTEDHISLLKGFLDNNPSIFCVAGNHDIEKQILPPLKKVCDSTYSISLKDELIKNYFSPPATIFRNEIVAGGVRFLNGMRYAEEGRFFYNIVANYSCAFINEKVTSSITHKKKFGDSGLSGNIYEMEKGELSNLKYAYDELDIGRIYYIFLVIFSKIKYWRRCIIVELSKHAKNN